MSAIQNNQASWTTLAGQQLDPKYEKCRNITEEIYKRINITFQIKKLESGDQSDISDNSEQIDSNELSNETDLFACDKSDISSSTEAERAPPPPPAPLNNNNDERGKAAVYKRPRKRFRKRVKKRSVRVRSDSEGSSDEAPLARAHVVLSAELKSKMPEKEKYMIKKSNNLTLRELLKPDDIKVPTVIIEKIKSIDKEAVKLGETIDKTEKNAPIKNVTTSATIETAKDGMSKSKERSGKVTNRDSEFVDKTVDVDRADVFVDKRKMCTVDERRKYSKDVKVTDWKNCTLCSLSFRGERGLRRHMSMSHIISPEGNK